MPRGSTAGTRKRSSSRIAAAADAPSADNGVASRRALGDVSNKGPSQVDSKDGNKGAAAASEQAPRRSRRLAQDPAEDGNPAEEGEIAATRSRASSKTRTDAKKKTGPVSKSRRRIAGTKRPGDTSKDLAPRPRKSSRRESTESTKSAPTDPPSERRRTRSQSLPRNLCSDILPHTDYGLIREPFDSSKYTPGLADHDAENTGDVLEVSNYVTDIYQRLYNAETLSRPHPYMSKQPSLNSMMRSILVDWLVEVHMKFRLIPETLYLCVNILDRYLSSEVQVQRQKLQLVGVTALLVACKYEEIYPPEVKDCVYITDRAYTRQDVLDMERDIVKKLEFKFTVPTGYPFLKRFLHITKASKPICHLANYYMERMLQEYCSLSYRPSLVAAAAVCLALNNPDVLEYDLQIESPIGVPDALVDYSGFQANDIIEVARVVASKVSEEAATCSRRELISVKRKYEGDRYDNVSREYRDPDLAVSTDTIYVAMGSQPSQCKMFPNEFREMCARNDAPKPTIGLIRSALQRLKCR